MNAIARMRNALALLRGDDVYFTVKQAEVFLLVVEKGEGLSVTEVADMTGFGMTLTSRIMGLLDKYGSGKKKTGRKLLALRPDPDDRRMKRIYFTAKGKALAARVSEILGG